MTTNFNFCISGGCEHEANPEQQRTLRTVTDWQAPEGGVEPEQRLRVRWVSVQCSKCNAWYKVTAYDLATASELTPG